MPRKKIQYEPWDISTSKTEMQGKANQFKKHGRRAKVISRKFGHRKVYELHIESE